MIRDLFYASFSLPPGTRAPWVALAANRIYGIPFSDASLTAFFQRHFLPCSLLREWPERVTPRRVRGGASFPCGRREAAMAEPKVRSSS